MLISFYSESKMKLYVPIYAETLNEKSDVKYAEYLKEIKADVCFTDSERQIREKKRLIF